MNKGVGELPEQSYDHEVLTEIPKSMQLKDYQKKYCPKLQSTFAM